MQPFIKPYTSKIFIVDETFINDLKEQSQAEYALFTEPSIDTEILRLPLNTEEIERVVHLISPSEIHAGNIVVKPVYSNEFVPIGEVSEDVVLRKYSLFVQFCVFLGARKVAVTNLEGIQLGSSNDMKSSLGIGGGGPGINADASAEINQSSLSKNLEKSIMQLNTEADGGDPDIEAANTLINQCNLGRDTLFSGLLAMCQARSNKLRRHEVTLDSSRDVSRIFDHSMGVKLEVMSKLYKGKAEFEHTRKSVEERKLATQLSITVEF
ncbi:hypothetical protein D0C27_15565 [Alcaligenes faecalis]|uniref:hypothetical protein n=1 Tax=Alcaligenes faecalis TaxID=511 RepID=UPI0010CA4630|nr:hypothetical protein [Alcaligenes faecalis]QCP83216.1 hypothetical protein D0C27_15565 [Alcaligenes faecalis]